MIRTTAATIAASLALVAITGTTAHARGDGGRWSEYETRRDAYLPVSVKYDKGSAVRYHHPEVRCFTAEPTKRARVLGTPVRPGDLVGYCTDGYVDLIHSDLSRVTVLRHQRPAR